jgi:hypothetical protein
MKADVPLRADGHPALADVMRVHAEAVAARR